MHFFKFLHIHGIWLCAGIGHVYKPVGRTHLDLDGEGVDEVLWDAVGVPSSVHAHRDELTLSAGNTTASVSLSLKCFKKININYISGREKPDESV